MKSFRLLPLVVFATLALLVLKGIGLVTEGGYVLTGVGTAQAQSASAHSKSADTPAAASSAQVDSAPAANTPGVPAANDPLGSGARTGLNLTPSAVAAANRASESLFSQQPPAPVNSTQLDAIPYQQNKAGEKTPLAPTDGVSQTERAVLERLSERRTELDKLQAQLDARQAIVAAAEKKMDERASTLKDIEAQINALVDQKKAADDAQFKSLVSMYETMKPKDAAKIFDQLANDILLRVAVAMNPRKMSPVLAAMTATRAQELTTLMAAKQPEPMLQADATNPSALPQIQGK